MFEKKSSRHSLDLIERCRKGDRKAQFEIYGLYYKAMYNTCLRMVSQPVEAEDIMQEAFISAFDRLDTFKGEVSFGAWLKKIVINKSIDALRHKKVRLEEVHAAGEDEAREVFIDVEEDNGNDPLLLVNQIKEAMKQLPDGYRVVLTLALLEGYDHEEIAQILSVSESTSRSQLARAKRRLNELLKDKIK